MMLSETIENVPVDPKGWLISEKLDGCRAYWDGKTLFSRYGNKLNAPKWFKDKLPKNLALDGELFTKRDDFENLVKIVRGLKTSGTWKDVHMLIYDAPLLN